MLQRDDTLWKAILEDVFDDFLRYCFPHEISQIDFDRGFEYLDKELGQLFPPDQDEYKPRFVDKLVKVFTKEGNEAWVLVQIEVQGQRDTAFAKRMFLYYARIFDKFEKPIVGIAIFTDNDPRFVSNEFRSTAFGATLSYSFNTIKVLELNEEELKKSKNPFAFVLQVVKTALIAKEIAAEELFNLKLQLVRNLLVHNLPKAKIRSLMNFLRYYVRFESTELVDKFDLELGRITQTTKTMGIEEFLLERAKTEGKREGILEGEVKGKLKGREIGIMESKIETAKKLKELGVAITIIKQSTGLDEKTISEI